VNITRLLRHLMTLLPALAAGAGITLALAPFDLKLLILLGPALLYLIQRHQTPRQAIVSGYCFGLGFWGAGASWVYVSINTYGNASPLLAGLLTSLFVMALALLFAVQGWLFARLARTAGQRWLLFCAVWVGFEWLRSWFLTGFPWLYLGYAALDTPLERWAPLAGVWGLSLILLLLATGAARVLADRKWLPLLPGVLLAAGSLLLPQHWTHPTASPALRVVLVQPNIPQLQKWQPDQLGNILHHQIQLSLPHTDADLLIWPETAIPATFNRAIPMLGPFLDQLDRQSISLISGFPYAEADPDSPYGQRFHNSLGVFSSGNDLYHKQRLVPFGEYVPLEKQLRGVIDFFNLPMSSFSLPQDNTDALQLNGMRIAPAICYEIAYPQLVKHLAEDSGIMLTVSNDTWFGRSIAPEQHLQIARMRALENGRWLLRGTNNGYTALIDPQGKISAQAPLDTATTLTGQIQPMQGSTPWQRFGTWPILAALVALLLLAYWRPGQRNPLENHRTT
jgi:apolipoprotein N-acyltransferase